MLFVIDNKILLVAAIFITLHCVVFELIVETDLFDRHYEKDL